MSARLWKFNGGLKLAGHKSISMQDAVQTAPLPKKLVIPLQQHIGQPAEPCVKVGAQVLKGQIIASSTEYVSVPIHAPTSGTIIAIEEHTVPHPSGMSALCMVLEPDQHEHWIEKKPVTDYQQLDPSALRNVIRDAGIVGLGGAGFPSFIKLNPGPGKKVETLILNGAECEPYITCDAMLMQQQPRRIIDGLLIMRHALQAKRCMIGIEDNKPAAIHALQQSLSKQEAEFIQVVTIPTIYPAGGEKQLIKVLTGKEVPSNGLPINIGVVCHNVGTAAAIARAVQQGEPLVSRYVTITGEGVDAPNNYEVLIGTPFAELIDLCGRNSQAEQIVMGGPMMGFVVSNEQVPVTKTTNCILVGPQPKPVTTLPCIRCGQCAEACPVQLLPQQLYWHARARDFDKTQDYNLFDCIECGCCAYVCPSHIPLVQYYRFAKTEIWAQERDKQKSDIARERHEFHLLRLERKKREDEERKRMKRELLKKAQGEAPSTEEQQKKAAIAEAMARVKAKRDQQQVETKNVDNLTPAQQQAIDEVEQRRAKQKSTQQDAANETTQDS